MNKDITIIYVLGLMCLGFMVISLPFSLGLINKNPYIGLNNGEIGISSPHIWKKTNIHFFTRVMIVGLINVIYLLLCLYFIDHLTIINDIKLMILMAPLLILYAGLMISFNSSFAYHKKIANQSLKGRM